MSLETASTPGNISMSDTDSIGGDTPYSAKQSPGKTPLGTLVSNHQTNTILGFNKNANNATSLWIAETVELCDHESEVTYHYMITKDNNKLLIDWYPNETKFEDEQQRDQMCLVSMTAEFKAEKLDNLSVDSFFYYTADKYKKACPWDARSKVSKVALTTKPAPQLHHWLPLYFKEGDTAVSKLQAPGGYGLATKFGFAFVHMVLQQLLPGKTVEERVKSVRVADFFEGKFKLPQALLTSEMLKTETLASLYLKELLGKNTSEAWASQPGPNSMSAAINHIRFQGYYWGITPRHQLPKITLSNDSSDGTKSSPAEFELRTNPNHVYLSDSDSDSDSSPSPPKGRFSDNTANTRQP